MEALLAFLKPWVEFLQGLQLYYLRRKPLTKRLVMLHKHNGQIFI